MATALELLPGRENQLQDVINYSGDNKYSVLVGVGVGVSSTRAGCERQRLSREVGTRENVLECCWKGKERIHEK